MSSVAATPTAEPAAPAVARGSFEDFWRRFRRDYVALVALSFIVLVVLAAVAGAPLAAHLTGHPPDRQFDNGLTIDGIPLPPLSHEVGSDGIHQNPNGEFFLLGTDKLGRDILVRLLYGARISLIVAFAATGIALLIGVVLGSLAGYLGGFVDALISRVTDLVMAFPLLLFLVMIGSTTAGDTLSGITFGHVLNRGVFGLVVLIGGFTWFYPARIVRAQILALREREFVQAATMIGASDARILRKHLAPHLAPALASYGMIAVATNLLLEAGVSFLGAGIRLPTASWGTLLGQTFGTVVNPTPYNASTFSLWPTLCPSLAIFLTVLALNHFGESLRDALDPRFVR
jgi:peptide/nickel transport system permease protein